WRSGLGSPSPGFGRARKPAWTAARRSISLRRPSRTRSHRVAPSRAATSIASQARASGMSTVVFMTSVVEDDRHLDLDQQAGDGQTGDPDDGLCGMLPGSLDLLDAGRDGLVLLRLRRVDGPPDHLVPVGADRLQD